MKRTNILTTTILAIAGIALTASPAKALPPLTYNNGDIFAGFRATGGTNGAKDYLINLGSISQFQSGGSLADGSIHSLGLSNLGADLTTFFGSGASGAWYNRTDFLWSVSGVVKPVATIGTTAYSNQTMFWSSVEPTPGTQSPAQHGFAAGSLGTPTNNMVAVMNSVYTASSQTTETQAGGLFQDSTVANTYGNTTTNFNGVQRFFTLSAFKPVEGILGDGLGGSSTPQVLDLWQLNPGATGNGTLLGGFEIDNTGNISFSSNIAVFAAPEPASIAMLTSGFLVLVGRRRRAARAVRA